MGRRSKKVDAHRVDGGGINGEADRRMAAAYGSQGNGDQLTQFYSADNTPYLAHDLRPAEDFYRKGRELLEYAKGRPVLLERRFTYMRDKFWDMNNTRCALWQLAMAGGIGAIWGYFPANSSPHVDGEYNKIELATYRDFWPFPAGNGACK